VANKNHLDILKKGVNTWNKWREDNPDAKPDLTEATLQGANLREVNFQGVLLEDANLQRANLREANLQEANLRKANLKRANLTEANLKRAYLFNANLRGAFLTRADLQEAYLFNANLQRAILARADFRNSDVVVVKYKKLGLCLGIRLGGCYGSPRFIRDAKDNEYIEEFRNNHKYLWAIWSVTSDCGRSAFRWILWSLFFALSFAGILRLIGKEGNFKTDLPFDWVTAVYYSIVTFTTLGFGDVTPISPIAMFCVTIEVILGYVMLGGLISIMATKLARRAA